MEVFSSNFCLHESSLTIYVRVRAGVKVRAGVRVRARAISFPP